MGAFVLGMKLHMCVCVCVCVYKSLPKAYMVYLVLFLSIKVFGLFVNKGHTTFDILHLQRQIFNFF